MRVLFAVEPDQEHVVRQRIDVALSDGRLQDPDGITTRWRLRTSGRSDVSGREIDHAARLIGD